MHKGKSHLLLVHSNNLYLITISRTKSVLQCHKKTAQHPQSNYSAPSVRLSVHFQEIIFQFLIRPASVEKHCGSRMNRHSLCLTPEGKIRQTSKSIRETLCSMYLLSDRNSVLMGRRTPPISRLRRHSTQGWASWGSRKAEPSAGAAPLSQTDRRTEGAFLGFLLAGRAQHEA